jgi:peptidoglycan/xylan/chitin deacetylase (PgdA/CDA1 family)
MFHHFHDGFHQPAQGSIGEHDFREMLLWLEQNYCLLGATEYTKKFESTTLSASDICLSFDDALKCQYDVAVPVLKEFGLDAFFFVYSSAFTDNPNLLEVYRYFRTTGFKSVNNFYSEFFMLIERGNKEEYKKHKSQYESIDYLSAFPFYSDEDKWFRYLRDQYLGPDRYSEMMKKMMLAHDFSVSKAKRKLWISETELNNLHQQGHIIGLHSYSHPTKMSNLSQQEQEHEYRRNYEHLSQTLGGPITVMSHPCGDYNKATLDILKSMGVSMGFRSSMSITDIRSALEIPRDDHANVFREMNQ